MLQKIDCLELDTTAVESIVLYLTGYNLQLQVVSSYINGWTYLLIYNLHYVILLYDDFTLDCLTLH